MSDPEALSELFDLTRMLRAHVEWQGETGATGATGKAPPGRRSCTGIRERT